MGADRRLYGRGRAVRVPAVLGTAALLLAGCASIPDSGDVEPVKASPRGGESQVRVYAVPPRTKAAPDEIVDGFLEAMTSDDPGFAMARKYLTDRASKTWQPEAGTTVLREAPAAAAPKQVEGDDSGSRLFQLYGDKVADVDASHAYNPVTPVAYSGGIRLVRQNAGSEGKEWRIDSLPEGLVLGESDFQRNYRSVNKYYFASGENWLVADPVYIRQRIDPTTRMDPVTQAVRALLEGPTNWLKPVVDSPFPTGTALRKGTRTLEFDDRNGLKVPLNDKAAKAGHKQCRKMAAQLLFTLRDLTSTPVGRVELLVDGSSLCVLDGDQAEEFAPDHSAGRADSPYFVDEAGRLSLLTSGGDQAPDQGRVAGPFGDGSVKLDSIAVARDERRVAGVTNASKDLYVSSLLAAGELGEPLVTSQGVRAEDRLSAPSWDGHGDLWVADRDPRAPRLLRLAKGAGTPQKVTIDGLGGARVEALRVSADGVRIALLLSEDGRTTLQIGRVERHGSGAGLRVSVVELQRAAPQMDTVTAVSWAGPSRLVVVGKESGGVQQVRYLQTDGSTSAASVLPGLNQVTAIAAADDEQQPLVADSGDAGIVQLPTGANWQTLVPTGSSPVYPG